MSRAISVGWVGLGKLGLPMAGRLSSPAQPVSGYDRDQSRIALAAERGVEPAATLERAVSRRDIVFTSLPDDRAVLDATTGEGGILSKMKRGSVLVETSTISPEASAELAAACRTAGVDYLRLPISGSSVLAEAGTITCFASGPQAAFERIRPVLARFTRVQTWLGEGEQARYAKLAVNLMIAVSAGMMAEALALARKGGIDWRQFLSVLGESAAASPFVKYKIAPLEKRDFSPMFSVRQLIKDLDLILDAAGEVGVPTQLAANLRQSYSAMQAAGWEEEDFIAIVRHVERLSGLGEPA